MIRERTMSGPYNYKSYGDFRKALDRELDALSVHSHRGGLRPGQRGEQPTPERSARPPDQKIQAVSVEKHLEAFGLKGEPGSPERWEQVKQIAPDSYARMEQQKQLQILALLVDQWSQSEDTEYHGRSVVAEVAKLAWAVGDMNVYGAARQAVEEIGGEDAANYLDTLMSHRLQVEEGRQQEAFEESEGERMGEVEKQLRSEYDVIERKLGPAGLEAADQVAQSINADGLLYDPEVDPERVRVMLRAAGEAGKAEDYALKTFAAHADLNREIKKRYGPSGADSGRERWEAEVDDAAVEAFERAQAHAAPEQASRRAIASREQEKAGKSRYMEALNAELEKLSSEPEHRQALRDQEVREYEKRHDEGGKPVVDYETLEESRYR
jgi:hypothetical protein